MRTSCSNAALTIGLIILLSTTFFIYSQPKIKSVLFPSHRKNMLEGLHSSIKGNAALPMQRFWSFREFYYPGKIVLFFTHPELFQQILSQSSIQHLLDDSIQKFSLFHSKKITSIEGFTTDSNFQKILDRFVETLSTETSEKNALWTNENNTLGLIITNQRTFIIARYSLQNASEANGYLWFYLREHDLDTEHKNDELIWIVVSEIENEVF